MVSVSAPVLQLARSIGQNLFNPDITRLSESGNFAQTNVYAYCLSGPDN